MENGIRLERSINIFSIMINEVMYEVQTAEDGIEAIYREDNKEISSEEREGIRDYIYENILK